MYYTILIRQKNKDYKVNVISKENLFKSLKNLLKYELKKDNNLNLFQQNYITYNHYIINIIDKKDFTVKKIVIIKYKNKFYFEKYNNS